MVHFKNILHGPIVYLNNTAAQVSEAIIKELSHELMNITTQNWIKVANEFNYKWQLPNCLGAIDGKHVPIIKPAGSGSSYFNFKRFHSIILMAVADANYKFLSIDVGSKGSEGDANVFSRIQLGRLIKEDDPQLLLPDDAPIGNIHIYAILFHR